MDRLKYLAYHQAAVGCRRSSRFLRDFIIETTPARILFMGAIAIVDAAVFYGAQRILDSVKDDRVAFAPPRVVFDTRLADELARPLIPFPR
jgi:hypothetical protein